MPYATCTSVFQCGGANPAIYFNDDAAWDVGAGDFTIETQVRFQTAGVVHWICAQCDGAGNASSISIALQKTAADKIKFQAYATGTTPFVDMTGTTTIAANTWYYVCVRRSGTAWSITVNTTTDATATASGTVRYSANVFGVGKQGGVASYLVGYLRNFRFTKGVARTPAVPTADYPTLAPPAPVPFIGIDTTRTDYGLRIGQSFGSPAAFSGWIDELSVMIGTASYTADYTPETAAFADPTPEVIGGDVPTLILDRGLDWGAVDEPFGVYLSSEINGVSAALTCERGDADHICVLLEPAPFDLFGKGEHQEPTRVAFGTIDTILRDWIVTSATPQQGTGVHVEGVVYDPGVYDGAMPHQGGEALPLPEPPGGWMIAGTPDGFAADTVVGGAPATPSADYVLAGTPDDPMTWLELEGPP